MKPELLALIVILFCTLPALSLLFGRLPGASTIGASPRRWRIAALGAVVVAASLVVARYFYT